MPTLLSLKREICSVGRRMWQRGYCAGNDGNVSVRHGQDRVLATPTGVSKGFMAPAMMTLVDLQARPVDRPRPRTRYQRTSEIFLHLAIYRKRPDVHAVVHAHIPHATAFACSGIPLPQGLYPEAEVCLGTVPTVPYSKPGYQELGEKVAEHILPETHAVLLGNHGAVAFGKDLMDAYYKLEMLESYCQILLLLRQIGRVNLLTGAQLAELQGPNRPPRALDQSFFRGLRAPVPRRCRT
jgi:L-fuculose-phosphate aldolase